MTEQSIDSNETLQDCALRLGRALIEFIYESVELGRRAAIRETWRWARDGRTDAELRKRLLNYLQETEYSRELDRILREAEDDLDQWEELLNMPPARRDLEELEGALSRAYADFPDSPAILGTRAVVLQKLGKSSEALEFVEGYFRTVEKLYPEAPDLRRPWKLWLLQQLGRCSTGALDWCVKRASDGEEIATLLAIRNLGLGQVAERGLLPKLIEHLETEVDALCGWIQGGR